MKILQILEIENDSIDTGHGWNQNVYGFNVVTEDDVIELRISNEQSCCETFGYFWCNDDPQDFVGATIERVSITNTALNTKIMEAHNFSTIDEDDNMMFVNFETNKGTLQFVLYNSHNGYYGHEAYVKSRKMEHKETL